MRRSCRVVRNLSESGDRRTSKSSREYPSCITLPFPFPTPSPGGPGPHSPSTLRRTGHARVKIRTDIDGGVFFFSKGIPRTESITPCVRLSSVFDARCRSTCSYSVVFVLSRGLLHRGLPMSTSSRACRNSGRWRQMGLWPGPRRETKEMRHLLVRSVYLYPLHAPGV